MIKILFLLLFFSSNAYAEDADLCRYFKYCGGSASSSGRGTKSIPSSAGSGNLNPGNISNVKGVGIEAIYQSNNPLSFNLVTGNGKIGALVSPTLENSFFGNRSIEIDDQFFLRKIYQTQYRNKKLNLALGAKLFDRSNAELSLGLSLKRNPDIKKINPGVGLSARLFFLNFGAYIYQDDVKINLENYVNPYTNISYSNSYGSSTYQEMFSVRTFTLGTRINNLTLDYGLIRTRYKFYSEETLISLYSSSYSYKKFLFNVALRNEESPNLDFFESNLIMKRKKSNIYYGAEYLLNNYFSTGLQYNYFLLDELSAKLTLFF